MSKKTTSILLVTALVLTMEGSSAVASGVSNPEVQQSSIEIRKDIDSSAANETTSGSSINEKLRSDIEKLLSDASAGKIVPTERPQLRPEKGNNLSRKAKIAIGVGVAVVVIALIVKYQKDHLFDDFRLGN